MPAPWEQVRKAQRPASLAKARREWWDAPEIISRPERILGRSSFAFDVPEHLQSSPMCPTHPRNKSKSMGVCVVSLKNLPQSWSCGYVANRRSIMVAEETSSQTKTGPPETLTRLAKAKKAGE
jgi:hypothetical protein